MLNMDSDDPRNKTSRAVIELGLRYAREDGLELGPGDTVPMGWLTANCQRRGKVPHFGRRKNPHPTRKECY